MATGDLDQDGKISFDEFIKVSNDTEFKAIIGYLRPYLRNKTKGVTMEERHQYCLI